MKGISKFQIGAYFKATILPSTLTVIFSGIALLLMIKNPTDDVFSLLINSALSFMWVVVCVCIIGLDSSERIQIRKIVTEKILKKLW